MDIYNVVSFVGIFVLLVLIYRFRRVPGQIFLSFVTVYSVARFLIEFLRDDMSRPLWGLTSYQILAMPVFAISAGLLARSFSRRWFTSSSEDT